MDFEIITATTPAKALVKHLLRCASIAWDTETFGDAPLSFDWIRGKQAWHQYSDGKRAWLVDCTKVDIQVFKPVLESHSIIKIIHNSAFDAAWTKREHKITVQNICDTRYQEQIILGVAMPRQLKKEEKIKWEAQFSASLKFCFKRRGWDDKMEFEPFYEGVPVKDSQLLYMVKDVDQLHNLMMDQQESINQMGLENVQTLENNICEVIVEMMNNGFGVDEKGWLRTTKKEEKKYNAAMAELKKAADINWNSWQQYCEYFGVHRTDDIDLLEESDLGKKWKVLLAFRKARLRYKNVTTYGRSFIEQHVKDGLLRGQYTQIVNTARLSSDNPNLQNIPAETEHRLHMIPGHGKNNVFVDADFSGQEMAIMAVGSGEESWMACLRRGDDLHSMVAQDIVTGWETFSPAEQKRQRKIVKIINFSIAYGAGVPTIALRAQAEEDIIKTRLASMRRKYPKLFKWLTRNGEEAKRTWASYSFAPFNRYRNLAMESEGWRRVNIGKNNPVQMTAADLTKLAMYLVWQEIKAGLPALFIHQLHDQLILECHEKNAKRVSKVLVRCMNEACITVLGEPLSNPEVKITTSWDKRTS